jgi:cytidylate kinase
MAFGNSSEHLGQALQHLSKHWETQRAAQASSKDLSATPGFTIALTREAGAQGTTVAQEVAKRLNWSFYDNELIERIAQDMGVRAQLLESVDERRKSWLLETVETFLEGPAISETSFVRHLIETVLALGTHGNCVIVGRGASYILPRETTLRVRIVAALEDRVRVLRQRHGSTRQQAEAEVARIDQERTRFIMTHFLKDPTDPRNYDMVLNSSRFPAATCAQCIIDALRHLQAAA